MRSILGWDYPPGCSSVPGDEDFVMDLTPLVSLRGDADGLYWDEYGELTETYPIPIPADEFAGLPTYSEQGKRSVGKFDGWNDELTDEQNMAAAAAYYNSLPAA